MSEKPTDWIRVSSGDLTAEIDPLGAQLSILRDGAGGDLLWDGDPSVWKGRAPLLFPIVGELVDGSYRLDSTTYRLPRHGFARGKRFDLIHASATRATFRLQADAATLEVYPFHFDLRVDFAIEGATLTVTTHVGNAGHVDMPASVGYHPAFRWPLPFGQDRALHVIEFANDEPAPIRRLNSAGLLTPERHPTPVSRRRLALHDALFQADVMIFDDIRSRHLTYGADAGPRIRVTYPDAVYLGLWSKPHANFICIEPWHGIADPEGYSGDFRSKPGVFSVAPGGEMTTILKIKLEDP